MLVRVVLAERPLRRSQLTGELFAEAGDPAAALRWVLADLRRSLGDPALLRGDPLTLVGSNIRIDVRDLEEGTLPDAEFDFPLLEGIELRDSPDFDLWLMMERSRWAVRSLEELRRRTLRQLAVGDTGAAACLAEYAVNIDPLDESAQELLLRALVADGRRELAEVRLAAVEGTFAREGLTVSPALRAAAQDRVRRPMVGVRAGVVAKSLLQAGTAALDAGAADGGIETLRGAAEDAARADDPGLQAEVQLALGSALVHAVRGSDGEGAVVLHRALVAAQAACRPALAADVLRELAFIDVQAGRHASAAASLIQAGEMLDGLDEPGLWAGLLAMEGMNAADRGRHTAAAALLRRSVAVAADAGRPRQRVWSLGVLARSLLLSGQTEAAQQTSQSAVSGALLQRWTAYLPWPQAIHAECLAMAGRWDDARAEAEESFALGCEIGDPCWEGMAARTLSLIAQRDGDYRTAWRWIVDARHRADRVPDRYVWVSCYIGLAHLELATEARSDVVATLAARLHHDAKRADLPEFAAWALVHQAKPDEPATVRAARAAAARVDNPTLQTRAAQLDEQGMLR